MNKLDKLTWKYFWQQKWEEISIVLGIIFIIISILGVVLQVGWACKQEDCYEFHCDCKVPYEPSFPRWIMYTGFVTTGIWILIGLNYWLSTNWKLARERARKEVKKKS